MVTFFLVTLGLNIIKGAFIKQPSSHNSTYYLRLGLSSKADQYESYYFLDQNYINTNNKLKLRNWTFNI